VNKEKDKVCILAIGSTIIKGYILSRDYVLLKEFEDTKPAKRRVLVGGYFAEDKIHYLLARDEDDDEMTHITFNPVTGVNTKTAVNLEIKKSMFLGGFSLGDQFLFINVKKKEDKMTISQNIYPSYYPKDWGQSVHSSNLSFLFPLDDHANPDAESIRTLFAPAAGAFYVYQPSKRRRALNTAIDRLEASSLPGFEYVIAYIHDKYRRNHSVTSISQTGRTLHAFLSIFKDLGRSDIKGIQRQDIAAYVEHEQEKGLKVNSVRNHLHTVYAYLRYLVENDVLPADILQKKIRIKLPEVLPKAIPAEDLKQILRVITGVRDRALILLLLHTGMRIGELLKVKITDIVLSERKILLYLGEKNLHGRTVFYGTTAELALNKWLATRETTGSPCQHSPPPALRSP
jgi:hypothetical protein